MINPPPWSRTCDLWVGIKLSKLISWKVWVPEIVVKIQSDEFATWNKNKVISVYSK
jgi:hypothetical protein